MSSSPTVTFNLRNLVGARRDAPTDVSPAPRPLSDSGDTTESDPTRPNVRLGSMLRPRADGMATSTRQESERPTASPISNATGNRSGSVGSTLFKYSANDAAGAAVTRPAADTFFYSGRASVPPSVAPTTEEVRRRFEELDAADGNGDRASTGTSRGLRVAPQIVSSADFVPYVHADHIHHPTSRSTSPNHPPAFVYAARTDRAAGPRPITMMRPPSPHQDFGSVTQSAYDDEEDDRRSNFTSGSRSLRGSAIGGRRSIQRGGDDAEDYHGTNSESYAVEEPNDDIPVVPKDLLRGEAKPYQWDRHPAHWFVLNILERRGVTPQLQPELVEYHMAHTFLDFLSICAAGTYFIKYGFRGTTPKERFLSLRMLPLDSETNRQVACIVVTIHQEGVQMIDRIRLEDLVGITTGVNNAAFERHCVHADVIKGGYIGQHRARLSTKGAFTLWFWDRKTHRPKALPLLTTNMSVVQVWTQCMAGIMSVNTVCVQRTNVALEMQKRFNQAQAMVNSSGYESN